MNTNKPLLLLLLLLQGPRAPVGAADTLIKNRFRPILGASTLKQSLVPPPPVSPAPPPAPLPRAAASRARKPRAKARALGGLREPVAAPDYRAIWRAPQGRPTRNPSPRSLSLSQNHSLPMRPCLVCVECLFLRTPGPAPPLSGATSRSNK